jgi:catechol 2,3-dioxygenase-like lactoylglutathione lyase family enzyme
MSRPALAGIHHVKIPVTDPARAIDWYGRLFGFVATTEFSEADGQVLGVAGEAPGLGDTQLTCG